MKKLLLAIPGVLMLGGTAFAYDEGDPAYMTGRELRYLITTQLEGRMAEWPAFQLYLWAGNYYLMTREELDEILQKTRVEKIRETPGLFVCRQYGRVLDGEVARYMYKLSKRYRRRTGEAIEYNAAFGRIVLRRHMMNWVVLRDGLLYMVEPSDDGVRRPGEWDIDIWMMDG